MADADKKVLSYGDVSLWRSDVELLSGNHFLNDRIIEFFFAQLEAPHGQLLVSPAVTFWISQCSDNASMLSIIEPLRLEERQVIMLAVNDNEDASMVGGGCHWSLLVYNRSGNNFGHYDSMGGINARHAKRLVSIIKSFLGPDAASANYKEAWAPQQINAYDCGVYVMATAQVLCEAYSNGTIVAVEVEALMREKINPRAVTQMRALVLQQILSLSEKQRKSCLQVSCELEATNSS